MAEEVDLLSALLGVNIDELLDGRVPPRPLGTLLKGQSKDLDAESRFLLAEAMTVAREIQALKTRLGYPNGLGAVGEFHANGDYGHPQHGTPERLAKSVRNRLSLGSSPITSVKEDVLSPLGIEVLWTPLPRSVDALAFATEETGAVIVANPHGAHMGTATGRRVAWAHEVCHILFDRPEMPKFARACALEGEPGGREAEWFERIERRARAFAPALLCPKSAIAAAIQSGTPHDPEQLVALVMETYGIGFSAARAHLHNLSFVPFTVPIGESLQVDTQRWEDADPKPPRQQADGPMLRTGRLAELANEAAAKGLVSARWVRELVQGPLAGPHAWTPPREATTNFRTSSMVGLQDDPG